MRPALIALCVCHFFSHSFAADQTQVPPPPAGNRFLFVVDTSASMARLEHGGRQAVVDLIYGGIDNQMRAGDTYGLWTFNQNVQAGQFPMQVWDPGQSLELASRTGLFLKGQRYASSARIDRAVEQVLAVVKSVKDVNVFILSDGYGLLSKNPFPPAFQTTYAQATQAARQAKKPLIITLAARNGAIAEASVTLAGEAIKLPAPPPLPAVAQSPKAPVPTAPARTVGSNAPASIIISKKIAKPRENQTVPEPASAPETAMVSSQRPGESSQMTAAIPPISLAPILNQTAATDVEAAGVPKPKGEAGRSGELPNEFSTTDTQKQATTNTATADTAKGAALASDSNREQSATVIATPTAANPVTPAISPRGSITEPLVVAARERLAPTNFSAAAPLAALTIPPPSGLSPRSMLILGGSLMVIASGLVVWLVSRSRSTYQTSFITRSMDRK